MRIMPVAVVLYLLVCAPTAYAQLRHVEMKTLGMD